jgi:predicted DsbA family dithiol-disulfide isomerase
MNRLAALVSASLLVFSCGRPLTPVDREVADTPEGVVTVVEYVDYGCRFCRELHPHLWELLEANRGAVRVVVKMVPLEKHEGARRAALAQVCAAEQGKSLEMHEALMRAPDTSEELLDGAARDVGVQVTEWQDCMRSDRAEEKVREEEAEWEELGADGLPMVFIGREKIVGLNDIEVYELALRKAQAE